MTKQLMEPLSKLYLQEAQRYNVQSTNGEAYIPQNVPLTEAVLKEHLAGKQTIAIQLGNEKGFVRVLAVDFDGVAHGQGEKHWGALKRLYEALTQDLGLPAPAISISGRKGFGLWISLAEPIPVAQAQAFVRMLRGAYLHDIPSEQIDLRPDCVTSLIAAQAVIKLPPCLHRANQKWAAFISFEEGEQYVNAPWLETAPDLEKQAALLAELQSVEGEGFKKAFELLKAKCPSIHEANAPQYRPNFEGVEAGFISPCVRALVEKGVPHEIQYNQANMNLAYYCHSANINREQTLLLATQMAQKSSDHPSSKSEAEKISNFKSIRPAPFYCEYAQNNKAWSNAFGGLSACGECPANPNKGANMGFGSSLAREDLLLKTSQAKQLIKHAWNKKLDLSHIKHIWPMFKITYKFDFKVNAAHPLPRDAYLELDWFRLAASLSTQNTSLSAFRHAAEKYIHDHKKYEYVKKTKRERYLVDSPENSHNKVFVGEQPEEKAKKAIEGFYNEISTVLISDEDGQATLQCAEDLEPKVALLKDVEVSIANPHNTLSDVVAQTTSTLNSMLKIVERESPFREQKQKLFSQIFEPRPSVETPFTHLNYKLEGGFQAGRLYVLIAPPKSGKTTFAANCMDYAASHGHPVLYMGYEMGKAQLVLYGVARKTGINASKIQAVRLTEEEEDRVLEAFSSYAENEGKTLTLVEAGSSYTFANAIAWVCVNNNIEATAKVPLVVVDYLQIAFSGKKEIDQHSSATERVGQLAVICKQIAREHKVALLVLSSVTKAGETDSTNKGKLEVTAARDSLAIIHAADGVMSLQSNPITVKRKEGKESVSEVLDPWHILSISCAENGEEQEATQILETLQKIGSKYPQKNETTRSVLYLERHRGSTGPVPLYYYKPIHKFIEVPLTQRHKAYHEKSDPSRFLAKAKNKVFAQQSKLTQTIDPLKNEIFILTDKNPEPVFSEPKTAKQENSSNKSDYLYITNIEFAKKEIEALQGVVSLDLETTGLDPISSQIRLLSLYDGSKTLIIDLFKAGSAHALGESLNRKSIVAHNAIFDMQFLKQAGVEVLMDCTMIGHHILTGEQKSLKDLVKIYLEIEMNKDEQLSNWANEVLTDTQLEYAAMDVIRTFEIWLKIKSQIKGNKKVKVYKAVRDAQPAIVQMQLTGIVFNREKHRVLLEEIENKKSQLQEALKHGLNGKSHTSTKQLGEWLTEQLGGNNSTKYRKWEKTPKGQLKTGADELKKCANLLPIESRKLVEEALIPIKDLEKQTSAFGVSLVNKINPITNRIHPSFNLTGARTGRASCSNPNLQQIPRNKEFRELFLPVPGSVYIIADYSQIELRVAAEITNETKMLEAFRNGKDIHRNTAAMLLNKTYDEVPAKGEIRNAAKALNFGMLYGMGAKGLQSYAQDGFGVKISEGEAQQYINTFFTGYPNLNTWQQNVKKIVPRTLTTLTPLGRQRKWSRGDFKITEALNTPIQAGAAEIMLLALARLYEHLKPLNAKILAFIHDEIIVECLESEANQVLEIVKEQMIESVLAIFPNAATNGLVEAKIAKSWAEK